MTGHRFGLLSYPGVSNLGDAIQSLAARRFLPRVDLRVPRERMSERPAGDGPVRLIANGWFMENWRYWPPHEMIDPLLISMHFAEHDFRRFHSLRPRPLDKLLVGPGAEYLRARGPVGARDEGTLEELERRGIPAYLSGCLTLTLQRPTECIREDFVVACDLSPLLQAHLQRLTRRRVIVVSHGNKPSRIPDIQEADAEATLDLYARAAAVVTTRVHAALPCLALETPVLLVDQSSRGRRVHDAARLVHSCQGYDFLRNRHDFDLAVPPPNPDAFRPLVPVLEEKCRAFVSRP